MKKTKQKTEEKVDVLCIGAHQDDIDVTIGGIIALLAERGYKVEILDLTQREGMYFSEEEEEEDEANRAAEILGVNRSLIDLGLLKIENNEKNRMLVADEIRKRRPDIIITLWKDETHPDHNVVHNLVLDAFHYSFATAIKTKHDPWRPKAIYFTATNILYEKPPENALFVDVSKTFHKKREALKSYASQMLFHAHNRKYVLEHIEALNRAWGLLIGKEYAEIIIPRLPVFEPFPELEKK